MRKTLLLGLSLALLGASTFAPPVAPAAGPTAPAPRALTVDAAPLQPTPLKQAPASPMILATQRRRRRGIVLDFRPRDYDYTPTPVRPSRHRYNRSARRHARNGWGRHGY